MTGIRSKLLMTGAALFAVFSMSPAAGYAQYTVAPTQPQQNTAASTQSMAPTDDIHYVENALKDSGLSRPNTNNGIPDNQFANTPLGQHGMPPGGRNGLPALTPFHNNKPDDSKQNVQYRMAAPDPDTLLYGVAPPPRVFDNVPR